MLESEKVQMSTKILRMCLENPLVLMECVPMFIILRCRPNPFNTACAYPIVTRPRLYRPNKPKPKYLTLQGSGDVLVGGVGVGKNFAAQFFYLYLKNVKVP